MFRSIALTVLLLVLAKPVVAAFSIAENGYYFLDPKHQLDLTQIQALDDSHWIPINDELSLGLTNDTAWIRLPLTQEIRTQAPEPAILYLSNPLLNQVTLYLMQDDVQLTSVQLGDHIAISQRPLPIADIYWQLPNGWRKATHLYAKIRSDSFFQTHFVIRSTADVLFDHGRLYWMFGLFYGALAIMLLYNLLLFFLVRDIHYLYYSGYVLMAGLFHSVMDGLAGYSMPAGYHTIADRLSVYCLDLANIFALLFVIKFLELREKMLLRATRTLILMFVVAIVIEVIEGGHVSTLFSMFMCIVTALSITYLTMKSWLGGNQQARYLALAWVVLLLSVPVYAMALYGVIPHNLYTLNTARLGVVLELALISFSLAHRINLLRQERMQLQSRLNKELGDMVRERTRELENANAKLQALSETDSLTQLKNRAFFGKAIEAEATRAKRHNASMAILLADLDHFKQINDTLGHNAGDYCLTEFARIFADQLKRITDIACRYGGEEFIALLPTTDREGALAVAEKVRSMVQETDLSFEGNRIQLTVSIGVAAISPLEGLNYEAWVGKADKALYFAKTRRNCVASMGPGDHPQFA